MLIGVLLLEIQLPGCQSLKEKRSRLKPLLARLHREFNISTAEVGHNDSWKHSAIACSLVSNDRAHADRSLNEVIRWIETYWPDVEIVDSTIELY